MNNLFELIVENDFGEILNLTEDFSKYIVEYDGLNPPNATLFLRDAVGMDGQPFESSKIGTRAVTLTIHILGDDVAGNRLYLYKFFRTKRWCKIRYKNKYREVYFTGYVESNELNQFTEDQTMQVSIVCPDPFLYGIDEIKIDGSNIVYDFTFPFSAGAKGIIEGTITDDPVTIGSIYRTDNIEIDYQGDETSGLEIIISNIGKTRRMPVIFNDLNGEFFAFNELPANESWLELRINSNEGYEAITLTKLVNQTRVMVNGIIYKTRDSKWTALKLNPGYNQFTYYLFDEEQKTHIYLTYRNKYEAV